MQSTELTQRSNGICRRMELLRQRMDSNVEEIVDSAQSLFDWKSYLRQYPLAILGLSAAAGFLLVPGRRVTPSVKLDQDTLGQLAEQTEQFVSKAVPSPPSWLQGALTALGPILIREAMTAVASQAERYLNGQSRTPVNRDNLHRSGGSS